METKIKTILKQRGMPINALHKLVGGNRPLVYQVANGFWRATVPMRGKMASILGLPVDELFDKNGMARKE